MNKVIPGQKFFIFTFGCQMNVRDSEVICGLLIQAGYSLVDDPKKADIVIFNTCSVRQHAEDKVWSEIGRLAKTVRKEHRTNRAPEHKPIIGLVGCMAQNHKEQIFERSPEVDFVVGPADIDKIPGIVHRFTSVPAHQNTNGLFEIKIWETDGEIRPEEIYHTGFYEDKEHAYVVISEGCSNLCSYCVVPYVRGPLRNRSHTEIIKEIKDAVGKGIARVTLLGQNVNAFKSRCHNVTTSQVDFVALLKMVNKIHGLKEFGFITSHPRDTTVELFKAMAECDKLKKYLHLPVQSGSDKILERMNRGYTRKFYLDLIDNYRKNVKNGLLSSDIIVGFSQESEDDFKQTYDLVKQAQFDSAYIFKYSPRPHSQAYNWMDDVSIEEKEKRHRMILDLQKQISKRKKSDK